MGPEADGNGLHNPANFPTYRAAYLAYLNTFEKAGIIPPAQMKDVAAVRKMLLGK